MLKVDETAFAKINLDLRVCRRRADGYHDLDSLVVFAEAGDRLTFDTADSLVLAIDGPFGSGPPSDDRNLVARAANALAGMVGRDTNVRITLEKTLPVASGLGGGSADAAATLRGLVKLWNLPLSLADLIPLAGTLGADVPVCLGSTPVRMQGTGDQLTPMSLPIDLPMVLANPGTAVSTPDVFRRLQALSGARDPNHDIETNLVDSVNDLEAPAVKLAPVISSVLNAIRSEPGCTLARMSGSGATCFGLFHDTTARDRAASNLSALHPDWWVIGTDTR